MAKSRSHKDSEDLRGLVRELRSQIRQLEKRLRSYEKFDRSVEDALIIIEEADMFEASQREEKIPKCSECRKGEIKVIDLGRVKYHVCQSCSFRKKS